MNKDRLNGTAKLDLVARLTRMFAPADGTHPNHGHAISQHTVPTADDRWIVRHADQNYSRRQAALSRRTRNRRKLRNRMSPTQLMPSLNRPYVRPENRKAAN
jgi:hypothetical protein